ncbi:MAG: NAD kinase [Propionicimonas sp.]|nr:NAD kinase [Propionicimonas sp.]MEA4945355.1 NAD kinase [Propionicimonas sp.]MEA5116438.1 NAD kinase [Propionicimonas sp.]
MNHPRQVAVTIHPRRPAALESAVEFITGMHRAGILSLVGGGEIDLLDGHVPAGAVAELSAEAAGDCELAVVFGGDGNILRAAEWALPRQIPVLGVNLGHVGFLAELEPSEVGDLIERVVSGDFEVEERMTIDAVVRDRPGGAVIWESFALNECSIEKLARERMLEVLVRIDDRPLSRWATDGVLVATPTGSTAYAFSAHGPVVWPDIDALLLVPLSAHALFNRPLVLSDRSSVSIEVLPATPAGVLWCDGRRSIDLPEGAVVEVRAGKRRLRLARTSEQPFVHRLVRKFDLPVDGWRGAAERDAAHAR